MKEIQLTRGYVTQVDDEDYEWLNQWKWKSSVSGKSVYANRARKCPGRYKYKSVSIQSVIMETQETDEIDHKDGNGLNNQKINLRICTHQENSCNRKLFSSSTSGFKGVSWNKRYRKWRVSISKNGRSRYLGQYNCLVKAAKVYDDRARLLFGEYACLNFPEEGEQGAR